MYYPILFAPADACERRRRKRSSNDGEVGTKGDATACTIVSLMWLYVDGDTVVWGILVVKKFFDLPKGMKFKRT